MGYLKDIHSNLDIQAFPSTRFEIAGDVPAAQCSEAKIESTTGIIGTGGTTLTDVGKFVGFNLATKQLHLITPIAEAGTFPIANNTDDVLQLVPHTWGTDATDAEYFITDGGELILTRNTKSFAQFIHAAGYAYTIKGGKLYTNMPSAQLKNACTILFDPLT